MSSISMSGRKMHVVSTDPSGEVGSDTIFHFDQDGSIVTARYAGGKIRIGYLVGKIDGAVLEFRYAQVNVENNIDGGHSTCEIGKLENGELQLIERFKWSSREGTGTNVYEEIKTE
ncbi:MAG: hypothetical protein HC888_09575 [Candidatus Competibacteraceae bacterium]|nr:hypothetical protein [Candidatus Competibacteraceae bacterium]